MTYITTTNVRQASGAPSSLITDTTLTAIITKVEGEMEKWLNTKFAPTRAIDVLDGNGNEFMFVRKNPLLKVEAMKVDGTSIDVSTLNIERSSGKIELSSDSSISIFIQKKKVIIIKYLYGLLQEKTTVVTTSDGAVTAGTAVAITVDDDLTDDISVNDYIEIYGMDGNRETAKVTAIDSSTITVDKLIYRHEDESIVTLLEVPEHIKRFMEIEAAIAVGLNAVGATYTFNASYQLGELQVTKGVPYTHWRETIEKNIKERDMRRVNIHPRPYVAL